MKMILFLMFFINMNFISLYHPLSLTLIIIIQTIYICLLFSLISMSSWFSYILFLTFLGGMLVLFIYMTTLASNEKFNLHKSFYISLMLSLMFFFLLMFKNISMIPMIKSLDLMNYHLESPLNFIQLFNMSNMLMTIFLISYLLVTLIIVIYICKMNQGPLRQLTYE